MYRALIFLSFLLSCHRTPSFSDRVGEALKQHPEFLAQSLEKNALVLIASLQQAARQSQDLELEKEKRAEAKKFFEGLNVPLRPKITAADNVRGERNAPLILVEYADFECPYSVRGYFTVQALRGRYGSDLQFIYKHAIWPEHKQAKLAALYFEALGLQSAQLAWDFHDALYEGPQIVGQGEKALWVLAQELGADMSRLKKNLKSPLIQRRLEEQQSEAQQMGFLGTPSFVLNGVPVLGAHPPWHFDKVIDELKKRQRL